MTGYVDAYRAEFGVEPICNALQVAPSSYYAAKTRPVSARSVRDAVLIPILVAIWMANYRVYGAHKLWKAALRAGHDIGRDQVARLMRVAGIEGVSRKRTKVRTTRPDPRAARPPDLVRRDFTAAEPNQLWVTDLTYVPTWSGFAYVCFIVDAFSRMIVGWRVAGHIRTDMVLDALEMARWARGTQLEGLRCHSDAGSSVSSRASDTGNDSPSSARSPQSAQSETPMTARIVNALAESVNGLYKTELIYGPDQGPWHTIEDVELATLASVHWHNTTRLHGYLHDVPPAEFEAEWREANTRATLTATQSASRTPGGTSHPQEQTAGPV